MVDSDNDDSTFGTLAAATARALSKVKQFEEISRQPDNPKDQEEHRNAQQKPKGGEREQRRYVDHRLRELAAFERRARGKGFKR